MSSVPSNITPFPTAATSPGAATPMPVGNWHGQTFSIKQSIEDTDIEVSSGTNAFEFKRIPANMPGPAYMYELAPQYGQCSAGWDSCRRLVSVAGLELTWFVPTSEKLDPSKPGYAQKLGEMCDRIKANKLDDPTASFERLVGTVAATENQDSPIVFYRVKGLFAGEGNQNKYLVIGVVQLLDGSSPGGMVAADQ
jgi:hypothetical protein